MSACSGFGSWCCSRLDARLVLLVRCCLCCRTAGVVGCWLSVVFAWPGLVLCWCVPPAPVRACRACACPPPWWGVLCWCVAPLSLGRAVSVAACRGGGVWFGLSSSVGWVVVRVVLLAWPGLVLFWCVPPPLLGRAVFVRGPPLVGSAVSACSGFGSWCCSRLDARLVLLVRCCLRRRTAGVVGCWLSVLFAWPGSVLCWFVPPPLLGRAALVCGPPHGGACCVGACPPSCWGVLCWCPPAAVVVFGLGCRRLLDGLWLPLCCWPGRGWCCAGACPPPPLLGRAVFVRGRRLVGRAVSAYWGFGLWCCSRLDARLVLLVRCCLRPCTACVVGCLLPVVFAWPGLVLCWCVPPPLFGRAVLVRGPSLGGACCVGVIGFRFVVL